MCEQRACDTLQRLGAELAGRQWIAELRGDGRRAFLHVVNPDARKLSEDITCRFENGRWSFYWSWDQVVGPVADVSQVADRIQFVLCGVPS